MQGARKVCGSSPHAPEYAPRTRTAQQLIRSPRSAEVRVRPATDPRSGESPRPVSRRGAPKTSEAVTVPASALPVDRVSCTPRATPPRRHARSGDTCRAPHTASRPTASTHAPTTREHRATRRSRTRRAAARSRCDPFRPLNPRATSADIRHAARGDKSNVKRDGIRHRPGTRFVSVARNCPPAPLTPTVSEILPLGSWRPPGATGGPRGVPPRAEHQTHASRGALLQEHSRRQREGL